MKPHIAIVAALPQEIAPLIREWPARADSRPDGVTICEIETAIAVCAGMGRQRVEYALKLAADRGPLDSVISIGYAGALRPGIATCSIHWPATVIDAATGEQFRCEAGSGTLVTVDHVARRDEKSHLAARFHADLVDMEAAAVARAAAERNIPFRALKVVSDEADDALPDFNRFINSSGQFRKGAFTRHLALHPWLLPASIRLGRRSARASRLIAKALHEVLENAE